ncbi:MAG: hypothetical protein ACR2PL_05245 [Dehalococcoidia bacterium]
MCRATQSRLPLLCVLLTAATLCGLACRPGTTSQVVPIAAPLPVQERARYRIESDTGQKLGEAILSIENGGGALTFTTHIELSNGNTNDGRTVVEPPTLRPRSVDRSVTLSGHRIDLHEVYSVDGVTSTLENGSSVRTHVQKLPESAYDDQESLFLWRTLQFATGYTVHYVNVLFDARGGTISRPLGTAHVAFRERIRLPTGNADAWRVEFSAAGLANTAWYEDSPGRRLLKYRIPAQQVTYYLDEAS